MSERLDIEKGTAMARLEDLSDEELLTACIWAEARGEPPEGQKAVCNVILNRVKKRMCPSIRRVILQPKQFSWTDAEDPNFTKVFTAVRDDAVDWQRANDIAKAALAGTLDDNSKNADHYLNIEATRHTRGGTLPKWAEYGINNNKVTVTIGHHTFLKLHA